MSLFSRLFKGDKTQEGEQQPEGAAEAQDPAPAASAEAGGTSTAGRDAAKQTATTEARANEPATKPAEPGKPAALPSAEARPSPPPLRPGGKLPEAKIAPEKAAKPAESKPKDAAPSRPLAPTEKSESSAGKAPQRAMPAPSAGTARATPPEPRTPPEAKAAPRPVSAGSVKAAGAPTDKHWLPNPKPAAEPTKPLAQLPVPGAAATAVEAPAASAAAKVASPPAGQVVMNASAPASEQVVPPKPVEAEPSAREVFDASAPQLLEGVLHLMLELCASSSAPADWAASCVSSLRMLRAMAAKLENAALLKAMDDMLTSLQRPEREGRTRIEGELRDELLAAYAVLRGQLPAALDPELELARRDPQIVDALLLQVHGVQWTTLNKLRNAGWNRSNRFFSQSAAELARDTGIELELAERIVAAFRAFRDEFATLAPTPTRADELRRLSVLLQELRAQQARFEHACARFGEEDLRERRVLREARLRSLRGIYALLARLGELERIAALERAPFQAKIAELTSYLSSATRATALVS